MEEGQHISGPMAVLCIVNGMIGGLILILPVMALEAGWLLTLVVVLITGLVSYYSCYLCLMHTGSQADLDVAILKHFGGSRRLKVFYEVCILGNLLLIDILYYELIVLQWEGLVSPYNYTLWNPLINFTVLFALTLLIKFKEFGASLMAYGIVSIAAYLLFISWVVGSEEDNNDTHQLQMVNGSGGELAAALGQAFAIQAFFIPVLKKNRKQHKHKLYLLLSFVLGGLAYAFIAFMGSYGILHRQYRDGDVKNERTIEGYFEQGMWQVNAIEVIYLVHLYSVFPEYLLIGKKRFFSIFGLKESASGRISRQEVAYSLAVLGFCLGMALMRTSLRELIDLNGAVLGFFFIYFFPVLIHAKCCFMKHDQPLEAKPAQDKRYVEMVEEQDPNRKGQPEEQTPRQEEAECQNSDDKDINKRKASLSLSEGEGGKTASREAEAVPQEVACEGRERVVSRVQKVAQVAVLSAMLVLGLIIMGLGIRKMIQG